MLHYLDENLSIPVRVRTLRGKALLRARVVNLFGQVHYIVTQGNKEHMVPVRDVKLG